MRKQSPELPSEEGPPEVTSSRSGRGSPTLLRSRSRGAPSGSGPDSGARGHPGKVSVRCGVAPSPARPGRSEPRVPPWAALAHLPPVGTLRDEPGHQEADDAPEHTHHYQRHREAVVRHGCRRRCQPLHHRLTLVPPGSVNTGPRDQRAQGPASCAPRDPRADSAPPGA